VQRVVAVNDCWTGMRYWQATIRTSCDTNRVRSLQFCVLHAPRSPFTQDASAPEVRGLVASGLQAVGSAKWGDDPRAQDWWYV
jgi:hypothetical protein